MKILFSQLPRRILKITFILLGFVCIASQCKPKEDARPYGPQYEEDTGPERGTVSERLEGNWSIEDYLRNDTSILNQAHVATSGNINIKDVYWEYRRPTKENDWREKSAIYPWEWTAHISKDSITFSGRGISFCFWFIDPLENKGDGFKGWKITKLYKGSLHVKLITQNNIYKIYWKK